jgi:hypothetical protein
MKEFFKFEYIFAFAILLVLSIALFVFRSDSTVVNTIITVLVSAISSVTAFFFTKTVPKDKE